jgi:hypothetical protein
MGIRKKVMVYLSELVQSPVTVGYLKPIVLLPVAALNNLSTQQVEAILLHELSHIRRYDYLVNLVMSIIVTFLYFNPFVKQFMKTIEEERENCCDELVLQFGYDKVGYASALLTLEKLSLARHTLALGATGKKYLLSRIEKIVGMEKKKGFKRNQFAGILAALFCIVVFNSILIIREEKQKNPEYAYTGLASPFDLFNNNAEPHSIAPAKATSNAWTAVEAKPTRSVPSMSSGDVEILPPPAAPLQQNMLLSVALDEVEASLTKEQKEKVRTTVAATKKVLGNLQWKEVNTMIADAMTEKEKVIAKQQYLTELDKTVNWKNVEQNMKAQYEHIDWDKVNTNVNNAMTVIQLDSIQNSYSIMLTQLDKLNMELTTKAEVSANPLPDQSMEKIRESRDELRRRIDSIKTMRNPKKIVSL